MPLRAHCQYTAFSYPALWVSTLAVLLPTNASSFDPCGPQLSDERISRLYHTSTHYQPQSQLPRPPPSLWNYSIMFSSFTNLHRAPAICENLQRLSFREKREYEQYLKGYAAAQT